MCIRDSQHTQSLAGFPLAEKVGPIVGTRETCDPRVEGDNLGEVSGDGFAHRNAVLCFAAINWGTGFHGFLPLGLGRHLSSNLWWTASYRSAGRNKVIMIHEYLY